MTANEASPGQPAGESWAPDSAYGQPGRAGRGRLRAAVAPLVLAASVAAAGPLLGWLWAWVSPRVAVVKLEQGGAPVLVYADAQPEQQVAADGSFALLGLTAGIAAAVLAWVLLRRHRGVAVLVALTVGSLAASMLAWRAGYLIGQSQFHRVLDAATMGSRLDGPLGLRITDLDSASWWLPQPTGVAAVQALAAAFAYTVLAGFSRYDNLRTPPSPPPPPSPPSPPFPPRSRDYRGDVISDHPDSS